ncbi:ATPase [Bacteroidia bacterium]|nr:ATPase [Bacteroidia bacterium]
MKREIEKYLAEWKVSKGRKPLLIRGARQVGKTYSITKFAKENYAQVVYISFDIDHFLDRILSETLNPDVIIDAIQAEKQVKISAADTLIIFDEIQEQSRALTSFKYFNENRPDIHVIGTGSALGTLQHKGFSFPVGKVQTKFMRPMTFIEFVENYKGEQYGDLLSLEKIKNTHYFSKDLIHLLKVYFYTGGMPEVVGDFIKNKDYVSVRKIQNKILQSYSADFSKYNDASTTLKLNAIWNSIPKQISKENKKFKFSEVKKSSRADDYLVGLQWLDNSELIHRAYATYTPKVPLKIYEEQNVFKVFANDIGLLCAMLDVHSKTVLDENSLFTDFQGAIAEQFVCQQLLDDFYNLHYWTNEQYQNEIDFLLQAWDSCVPVEVKSGFNTQAKSLKVFREKYQPKLSFRLSLNDYNKTDDLIDLPLYAVHLIPKIIEDYNKNLSRSQ